MRYSFFLGAYYFYHDVLGSVEYPLKATVSLAGVYDRPTNDIFTQLRDEALGCPIRVFFPFSVKTSIFGTARAAAAFLGHLKLEICPLGISKT